LFASWCVAADWTEVRTANFELYTTADEDAGRSLILRLERLRAVLDPILGWRGVDRSDQRDERERPVCIIAFGSRDEFQQYAPISRSIGYFLPGSRRDFMVLDASADSRAAAHEFVHLVMARNGYSLPPWLNEGLAELYSNVEDGRGEPSLALGRIIPGRVLAIRRDGWIGLSELVSATPDSGLFTSPYTVDSAYGESWLLAHMLVLDRRYARKFAEFLSAIQSSGAQEAFRQVYDESLAQVECDLRAYLDVAQANVRNLGNPPKITGVEFAVAKQADFEGRTALAEMLGNYRGRREQSQELYQQLARDYPQRF
jgi:hypothetical protein